MYAAHWLFICSFVWMTGLWLSEPVASQQGTSGVFATQTGLVTFSSDAPLENISAESKRLKGVVDTLKSTFAFSVEVTSFSGFNSELQREHFNENYLESDKYPKAVFSGRIIESVPYSTPGTYSVRAKGQLEIHGIKKERIIPCKVTVKPGSIRVISGFSVNTSDHGIKIPRIVYDKISPDIQVTVEADLKPLP